MNLLTTLKITAFAGLFSGLVTLSAHGQAANSDFQFWPGASLKLDLPKKFTLTGQYRLRMIDNASYYKGSYLFATLDYRFNKHLSVFTNYRLALVDVGRFNRFALGFEAKEKFHDFTVSFRPMVQYQNQRFDGDDEVKTDNDSYLRPRVEVKYGINKRLDIYAYAEPFIPLEPRKTQVSWWQNSLGFKYEYAKRQKINPYFIWQPDFTYKTLRTNYIVGIDLEFTIKPFK